MRLTFHFLLVVIVLQSLASCGQSKSGRTTLGFEYAKQELKLALKKSSTNQILVDTAIKDNETAIEVSEAILF